MIRVDDEDEIGEHVEKCTEQLTTDMIEEYVYRYNLRKIQIMESKEAENRKNAETKSAADDLRDFLGDI
jgi:hypothetical protein